MIFFHKHLTQAYPKIFNLHKHQLNDTYITITANTENSKSARVRIYIQSVFGSFRSLLGMLHTQKNEHIQCVTIQTAEWETSLSVISIKWRTTLQKKKGNTCHNSSQWPKQSSLTKQKPSRTWRYTARKESTKNVSIYAACLDQFRIDPKQTKSNYEVVGHKQVIFTLTLIFLCIWCMAMVTDPSVIKFT